MARAVPYAADASGHLADPRTALPGDSFTCLECHESVSLRRAHLRQGRTVVAHFSHQAGTECAGESVMHLAAKLRLVEALRTCERPFVIRRVCQRFGCEATHDEAWEGPPFDRVDDEVTHGAYRLDVAALHGEAVVFGFEIYHRHRIGSVKAARLSVPWLEVQAEPTVLDPYVLCPVVESRLTGDEEQDLRWGLGVTRAELPEVLSTRLQEPRLLEESVNGRRVYERLVTRIFKARTEGASFLVP